MKCPNCNIKLVTRNTDNTLTHYCKTCAFKMPANSMVIEKIYAYVSIDNDGNEGIPAIKIGNDILPLVGADLDRMKSFKEYIFKLVESTGRSARLVEFSHRKIIEEIGCII